MVDTTSFGSLLFDLKEDPGQEHSLEDETVREQMKAYIREYMEKNDAPKELFRRLGFDEKRPV